MPEKINIANLDSKIIVANTPDQLKENFDKWITEYAQAGLDLIQVVSLAGDKPAIMVIFTPF